MSKINAWWRDNLRQELDLDSALELEFETHFSRFLMPTIRGAELTENELGLGTVVAQDARMVTLLFSARGENRLYARSDAPITRVMFNPGDTVTSHEGWQLFIDAVEEKEGLLTYIGTRLDNGETHCALREVLLDSKLTFSKPQDRLFAGQIDRMDRFARRGTAGAASAPALSPIKCTSPPKWASAMRRAYCWRTRWDWAKPSKPG